MYVLASWFVHQSDYAWQILSLSSQIQQSPTGRTYWALRTIKLADQTKTESIKLCLAGIDLAGIDLVAGIDLGIDLSFDQADDNLR